MINDEDGPLEEEIPGTEAIIPEITMDSPGGEEEIDVRAVQRREQLVIPGDQSIPIPGWLRQ